MSVPNFGFLIKRLALAAVFAAGTVGLSATVSAQGGPAQQGGGGGGGGEGQMVEPDTPEAGGEEESYSEDEIEAFAEANVKVTKVQEDLNEKLKNADDRDKAQEIQQKAVQKMDDAIAEAGLDYSTYRDIAMKANQDPELREKIEEKLN